MIRSNIISRNSARFEGGGLHACGGTIKGNMITGNSAGAGGGLYACHGTVRDNTVSRNSAGDGGGLSNCNGTIRGNTVTLNSAEQLGGGLCGCDRTIENNAIRANFAGMFGGGLFVCNGAVRSNVVAGNSADRGGGLYSCRGVISNNTIVGNLANTGGGLYGCEASATNCIIWGDSALVSGSQLDDSATPSFSCIQSWTGGGEGNIAEDPQFVDPDGADDDPATWEDNDYRLSEGSPRVDKGHNEDWMWDALDLNGNPRIFYGASSLVVDMGAYEYISRSFRLYIAIGAGRIRLLWATLRGNTYVVWSRPDLVTGQWNEGATLQPLIRAAIWTDPDTTSRRKFYRIEVR